MGEIVPRPLLDALKQSEVCAIIAVGGSRTLAAKYVGCHPDIIRRTAESDQQFDLHLQLAESRHEILHLKNITAAARDQRYWRASAWTLERKYPDRYAAREPGIVTVEQIAQLLSQFAQIVVEEVPVVEYRQKILARLDKLIGSLQQPTGAGDDR